MREGKEDLLEERLRHPLPLAHLGGGDDGARAPMGEVKEGLESVFAPAGEPHAA